MKGRENVRRFLVLVLTVLTATVVVGCAKKEEWKGFYEEDLTKYLTLGDYRALTYDPSEVTVSDAEVQTVIDERLEALTELTETDKPITEGMTVTFDRYCFIGGVSEPTLSENGSTYVCGTEYTDGVISELLAKMTGMKKGESAEVTVTLPAGYRGDGSPSTAATYRVTVLAVYEKITPALTDTLAATLLPGCESAEAYRAAVKAELLAAKQKEADYRMSLALKEQLMASSELIRCPEDLYTEYYVALYDVYEGLAAAVSQSLEEYLASSLQMTEEELEELLNTRTEETVKELLVLYSVVKAEAIAYTEGDIIAYAEAMAVASSGVFGNGDEYLAYYGEESVTEDYLWDRVMAVLLSVASPNVE